MRINEFVAFLDIKRPFNIELKSRKNKSADAKYWSLISEKGKLQSHLIRIYLGNNSVRGIETLIAHELIHAWQAEKGHVDIHGVPFKGMAEKMSLEFNLPDIYISELDTP